MKFFNKLELKYGRYAIPNLMLYLTAMYVAGFVIQLMLPQVYLSFLSLNWTAILKGQVWRLVTWLIYPPSDNIVIGALMIYVYYSIGTTVERLWGSFKFNIFIFSGIIFHILAALILYFMYKGASGFYVLTPGNLNLSIVLALILTLPDVRFLLFFFIPIKASWLGVFYLAMVVLDFFMGNTATKIEIVMSLLNVVVFLIMTGKMRQIIDRIKRAGQKNRFR